MISWNFFKGKPWINLQKNCCFFSPLLHFLKFFSLEFGDYRCFSDSQQSLIYFLTLFVSLSQSGFSFPVLLVKSKTLDEQSFPRTDKYHSIFFFYHFLHNLIKKKSPNFCDVRLHASPTSPNILNLFSFNLFFLVFTNLLQIFQYKWN